MRTLMLPFAALLLQLACAPDETGYGRGDSADPATSPPESSPDASFGDDIGDREPYALEPVYFTAIQVLDEVPRATTVIGLPGSLPSGVTGLEIKADGRGHIAEAVIVDDGFLAGLPLRFGDVVRFTTDTWEAVVEIEDDLSSVPAPDLAAGEIPVPYIEFNIEQGTSARIDVVGDPGVAVAPGERRCVARLDAQDRISPAVCETAPAAD